MQNLDDFLDAVKEKTGSDYRTIKLLNGVPQNISNWRGKRSMPSNKHIIEMCELAKLDLGEAIKAVEYSRENERPLREAGFANVHLLTGIGATSMAAMSLSAVHYSPESLILSGIAGSVFAALYIIRSCYQVLFLVFCVICVIFVA